ncbi:MAG: hypothetical protein LDL55_11800, partial [Armatimonadetes bacterium]|nr:hypothetical protein [Armatimonadota bacterium]
RMARDGASALQAARICRTGATFDASLASLRRWADALAMTLRSTTVPQREANAHERRVLASNLLLQFVGQLQDAVRRTDSDQLEEATLTLGQAARVWESSKASAGDGARPAGKP